MIDDLSKASVDGTNAQFDIRQCFDLITPHQTNRIPSLRWARNLRFLTFDDGVESQVATDNLDLTDLHGQCQRCEQRIRPIPGHCCAGHFSGVKNASKYGKYREAQLRKFSDPCIHVRETTCKHCSRMPLFPNSGQPSRFRIRRLRPKNTSPSELTACNHFLAVSYCWSSAREDAEGEEYTVVEEDGSQRNARASKEIIDRSVNFARQNGLRMIWIDQECIQQEDEFEKAIGVQAMDIVYSQAYFSIGLLHNGFENQEQLDSLSILLQGRYPEGVGKQFRRGPSKPAIPHTTNEKTLVKMLTRIAEDRWFTRAWILQEAFTSAGSMIMLLPHSNSLNKVSGQGRELICNDLSTTEIAVELIMFDQAIKMAAAYFDTSILRHIDTVPLRHQFDAVQDGTGNLVVQKHSMGHFRGATVRSLVIKSDGVQMPEKWAQLLSRLQRIFPEPEASRLRLYNPRRTVLNRPCSIATALFYLNDRHNSVPADRLAIIANLCHYSTRLSIPELQALDVPLSACVLVLSILNGDFSLFAAESYIKSPYSKRELEEITGGVPSFSWVPKAGFPLNQTLQGGFTPDGYEQGFNDAGLYKVSSEGLSLPGSLWKIDRFVDLNIIQRKYSLGWARLNRKRAKAQQDVSKTNDGDEEYQRAITHIVFEILMDLKAKNEIDTADAIWQSVFDSYWRSKRGQVIVQSVAEFPEKLQHPCQRGGMFRYQVDKDGNFYHHWLIERIMRDGGVWVGRLLHGSNQASIDDFAMVVKAFSNLGPKAELWKWALSHDWEHSSGTQGQPSVAVIGPQDGERPFPWDADPRRGLDHGMLQYDAAKRRHVLEELLLRSDAIDPNIDWPLNSLISTLSAWQLDKEHWRKHCAILDVDISPNDNALVLTPFLGALERIPTPATRCMQMSWVVQYEDANCTDENNSSRGGMKRLRATGQMVRGLWHLLGVPGTRYTLV